MSDLLTAQETPVIEKTRELCATLVEQESYKSLKAKLDTFVTDSEAQGMYQDLSAQQGQLVQKQQAGEDLSEDEIKNFEDARERLLLHPVAGGFVEAQQGFEELRDLISTYVTKTFELGRVPTAEEVAPKSGGCCGGGCGSGGGGGCSDTGGGCS